jgi:hypothetical protein
MCLQNIKLKWKLRVCQTKEDFQQEKDDGINIHVLVLWFMVGGRDEHLMEDKFIVTLWV